MTDMITSDRQQAAIPMYFCPVFGVPYGAPRKPGQDVVIWPCPEVTGWIEDNYIPFVVVDPERSASLDPRDVYRLGMIYTFDAAWVQEVYPEHYATWQRLVEGKDGRLYLLCTLSWIQDALAKYAVKEDGPTPQETDMRQGAEPDRPEASIDEVPGDGHNS